MSLQSEFKEYLGNTLTQIYWIIVIILVVIGLIFLFMGLQTTTRWILNGY